MALGSGYNENELAPFFNSLKQTGYTDDICFITREQDAQAVSNFAKSANIKIHFFHEQKPMRKNRVRKIGKFIDSACARYPILGKVSVNFREKYAIKNSCAHLRRHFFFRDILGSYAQDYQNVMMPNVRDVAFQRDPFDFEIQPESIYYFLEAEHTRIQDCEKNSWWITEMLGEKALQRLGPNHISCGGTIIGCPKNMLMHFKITTESIARNLRCCNRAGIDQAPHHLIVWDRLVPNIHVIPNRSGVVLTMQTTKREHWSITNDGIIVVDGDKIPNTVHQYDRYPDATKAILVRYT
jgi:hypothetical protein